VIGTASIATCPLLRLASDSAHQESQNREFLGQDFILQPADSACGIQVLGTNLFAVENSVAAESTEFRGHHGKAFLVGSVARVIHKPQHFEKGMRTQVLGVAIRHGTGTVTSTTEDAVYVMIDLAPLVRTLEIFLFRRPFSGD